MTIQTKPLSQYFYMALFAFQHFIKFKFYAGVFFFQGFVVNVIQFRNSFDSQGPGVPGVRPAEAVTRLHDFQQRYTQFEAKRKTLDSVQLLFGIVPTPFPELDKTGEVRIT